MDQKQISSLGAEYLGDEVFVVSLQQYAISGSDPQMVSDPVC